MVYIGIIGLSLLTCSNTNIRRFNNKIVPLRYIVFILCTILMVLLCGLRGSNVGNDAYQYYNFYTTAGSMSWNQFRNYWQQSEVEIGYKIIEFVFAYLKAPYSVFLLCTALISIIPPMCLIYKHSNSYFISIALYILLGLYCFELSGIRQSICIGILCISFHFVEKRKLLPFVLCVIFASLFHRSGLIFIITYFLYGCKLDNVRICMVFVLVALLFLFFGKYIFGLISSLYRDSAYEATSDVGGFGKFIFILFLAVVGFIYTSNEIESDRLYRFLYWTILIYLLLWPIVRFNVSAFRATFIFEFFHYIYVPKMLSKIKDKATRIIILTFIISVSIFYFLGYVNIEQTKFNNYSFFWTSPY